MAVLVHVVSKLYQGLSIAYDDAAIKASDTKFVHTHRIPGPGIASLTFYSTDHGASNERERAVETAPKGCATKSAKADWR
jgi:hypothetical protein